MKLFIEQNFYRAGFDLKAVTPADWKPSPPLIDAIWDEALKAWIKELNLKWILLIKEFDHNLICKECATSAFPLGNPFVVPGGRFREFYYWDTYWIVKGLLACGMHQTVKGIIENFIEMINQFGFIPNCSRVYCLNRSQPPVFAGIVMAYWQKTADIKLLERVFPALEKEYDFWMTYRAIEIPFQIPTTKKFILNIYKASSYAPRPESYREDKRNAKKFPTSHQQQTFYDNMASVAESGWDFSTRWFFGKELVSSDILRIVPVDLNSFMLKNEEILGLLAKELKQPEKASVYQANAHKRTQAMNSLFWNSQTASWNDWDMQTKAKRPDFYISNLLPLFDNGMKSEMAEEIFSKHKKHLFSYLAGIPISSPQKAFSNQQWDYPNAWAPYEWFLFTWLADQPTLQKEALFIAQRWLNTCYCGYLRTGGYLFEKYNSKELGQPGIGGEYVVQEGFGWTNGVVLEVVRKYPKLLQLEPSLNSVCANGMNSGYLMQGKMDIVRIYWAFGVLCWLLIVSGACAVFYRCFAAKWANGQ